jgi:hypothetical protein
MLTADPNRAHLLRVVDRLGELADRLVFVGCATGLLITAPYFIATKIEAFADRGHGDFLVSHDFEDLVAVMDGRPAWIEEVQASETGLRGYLADRFTSWLADPDFHEALPGHLLDAGPGSARASRLVSQLRGVVAAEFDTSD